MKATRQRLEDAGLTPEEIDAIEHGALKISDFGWVPGTYRIHVGRKILSRWLDSREEWERLESLWSADGTSVSLGRLVGAH